MVVVLGRHIEAFKFLEILLGDEPALSEPENFYQRMLARDPIEAIEQAKSFMATHSLSEYCDEIARPAISLAQKDSARGVLEPSKVSVLRETIESLFADLVRETWMSEREDHAMASAGDGKLPFLGKDQMVSSWRSEEPVLLFGVHSELDDAAASILASDPRGNTWS
jgi:hypothetical protein